MLITIINNQVMEYFFSIAFFSSSSFLLFIKRRQPTAKISHQIIMLSRITPSPFGEKDRRKPVVASDTGEFYR